MQVGKKFRIDVAARVDCERTNEQQLQQCAAFPRGIGVNQKQQI
jgi:hypothetical protein